MSGFRLGIALRFLHVTVARSLKVEVIETEHPLILAVFLYKVSNLG